MRTLTIILFFVFFTAVLSSQIIKGDRLLTPYLESPISFSVAPTAITGNLGGLFLITNREGVVLTALPQYGFAVGHRVVVGISLAAEFSVGGESELTGSVVPFARYYVVNNPNLMVYGGLRAGAGFGSTGLFLAGTTFVQPHLGIGLPIADGVIFAPELGYTIIDRRNQVGLSLGFDFVLGGNDKARDRAAGSYGRRSWMFGTQLGGIAFGQRFSTLRIMPEAYYFLGRRFALGLNAGTSLTLFDATSGSLRFQRSHIGIASRYFPVQGKHFDLFAHAGFQLEFDNQDFSRMTGDPFVDNLATMDGGLGGLLFVRKNVALEVGLNLRAYPQQEVFELGLNTGVRFFLGEGAGAVK